MAGSGDDCADNSAHVQSEAQNQDKLPPTVQTRWVTSRKAQVIDAIRNGVITIEEASRRYCLTIDELSEWQASFNKHGKRGLRTTFVQQYRVMRGVNSERP